MQHVFGAGAVWGTPLTDAYGATIANPTPIPLGVMQDVSVDISFDEKLLYGRKNFAIARGRGKGKVDWKAKNAQISGTALAQLFFGQAAVSGLFADYIDEIGTAIPASSPYTITPTVPGSGTWAGDLGVRSINGVPFIRVAASPAAGQYTVSAGAYTFAAADTGATVFISFQYTATSTTAQKSTLVNVDMGNAPTFRLDLQHSYAQKGLALSLFCCASSKLSLACKQDDFMIPQMDGSAIVDSMGRLGTWATAE